MKTKRGDVVLVLFPNSDLHTARRRPALVIQRDELSSGLA
jgi:mRNA interferase MazF